LSVQRVRAGQLRKVTPQLLWLPPRVAPHNQPLAHFRYILISLGLKDRKYLPFSLPLQTQHANTLRLPHTSSQATILANDSLVKANHILQPTTKTISMYLTANHLITEKKIKRPKLNRPPKSDSEIPTSNKYKSLDTEADDGSTSESDFQNPFSQPPWQIYYSGTYMACRPTKRN